MLQDPLQEYRTGEKRKAERISNLPHYCPAYGAHACMTMKALIQFRRSFKPLKSCFPVDWKKQQGCSQTLLQQSVQEQYTSLHVPFLNMVSAWWSSDALPLSSSARLLLPDVMNWLLLMDVTSWWFCCLCSSGCEFVLPPHPILWTPAPTTTAAYDYTSSSSLHLHTHICTASVL